MSLSAACGAYPPRLDKYKPLKLSDIKQFGVDLVDSIKRVLYCTGILKKEYDVTKLVETVSEMSEALVKKGEKNLPFATLAKNIDTVFKKHCYQFNKYELEILCGCKDLCEKAVTWEKEQLCQ